MQGRFPIRVELDALDADDFERILTEPEHSLIRQYTELLATEGVALEIAAGAVRTIAVLAAEINAAAENIGARRLYTVMERLLEDISFDAPERTGQPFIVDSETVRQVLEPLISDRDLARYIL
jgi:ATP-dependent HslUV protease ATP-binding subunit HslU